MPKCAYPTNRMANFNKARLKKMLNLDDIIIFSRGAGIGRQAGLKNPWCENTVWVQLPPAAHFNLYKKPRAKPVVFCFALCPA